MIIKRQFYLFRHKNIYCGYGNSNEYPQHVFLWRTDENYPWIIIKYPSYLFHWYNQGEKNASKNCCHGGITSPEHYYNKCSMRIGGTLDRQYPTSKSVYFSILLLPHWSLSSEMCAQLRSLNWKRKLSTNEWSLLLARATKTSKRFVLFVKIIWATSWKNLSLVVSDWVGLKPPEAS